ncbi:acid-sensing ion channel 4-B-like [Dermacentor andersoni]|uniref:acid-sensing ion channel 4-B-like n=1 Tax=Dermacentor andersoni TaxID=34620 RepID=UPI002415CA4A|nr:acid-sensing ion channel 2-like [Dermacentor andersoni]
MDRRILVTSQGAPLQKEPKTPEKRWLSTRLTAPEPAQTSGRLTGVWAQLKDAVTTYRLLFDESGLPGLRFVLGFRHPLRRLAWLAVYAVLFVLTMRDTHKLLTEYYAYDDRVNQEILEQKQVQFPAITVCNMNPWRKSVLCSEESFQGKIEKALQAKLCSMPNRNVTLTDEDIALSNRLKQWISEEQRRNLSRAEKLGHQLEDMIQVCRVHEGDCLSTKILEIRMVPRYGNCYCLGCNSSRFSWQAMQMSDPENGLRMSLNMEPEEFLPLTVDAGFYIMVHQAGAQEEVFDNAVYAPPGATTYIGVSKMISKNLKEPYKNPCQDHWPPELEKYVVKGIVYTKRACDEYCYQVHIFEKCGCRSFNHIRVFAPQLMESPVCVDVLRGDCERSVEAKIDRKIITCKCLTACEVQYYQTTSSALTWTSRVMNPEGSTLLFNSHLPKLTLWASHRLAVPCRASPRIMLYARGDQQTSCRIHVRVVVFMRSTKVLYKSKEPKLTLSNLFRNIGGLMGVYLGYSSLQIFHVLDVLVDGAYSSLSGIWGRYTRNRQRRREFHTIAIGNCGARAYRSCKKGSSANVGMMGIVDGFA